MVEIICCHEQVDAHSVLQPVLLFNQRLRQVVRVLIHQKSICIHQECAIHLSSEWSIIWTSDDGLLWRAPLAVDKGTYQSENRKSFSITKLGPNCHVFVNKKQHVVRDQALQALVGHAHHQEPVPDHSSIL